MYCLVLLQKLFIWSVRQAAHRIIAGMHVAIKTDDEDEALERADLKIIAEPRARPNEAADPMLKMLTKEERQLVFDFRARKAQQKRPSKTRSEPKPWVQASAMERGSSAALSFGGGCVGELLYNGICLPSNQPWPPPWNTTYFCKKCNTTYHGGPPSEPRYPPWYFNPPDVINISLGRQLFVDTFLIESMLGVQLSSHAATWEDGQVLKATEPWEEQDVASGGVPYNCDMAQTFPVGNGWLPAANAPEWFKCGWPQGPRAVGYAGPFQGAVAYDEAEKLFRMWYTCGRPAENAIDKIQGMCHAESRDGRTWDKRLVGQGENLGTNRVYTEAFDSAIVWQDYTEPIGSPRRWVRRDCDWHRLINDNKTTGVDKHF